MPVKDGIKAMDNLKKQHSACAPIIVLKANAIEEDPLKHKQ